MDVDRRRQFIEKYIVNVNISTGHRTLFEVIITSA